MLTTEEQEFQQTLLTSESVQKVEQDYDKEPEVSLDSYAKQVGVDVEKIKNDVEKETTQKQVESLMPKGAIDNVNKAILDPTSPNLDPSMGIAGGMVDVAQNITNGAIGLADWFEDTAAKYGVGSGEMIDESSKVDWSSKLGIPEDNVGARAMRSITKYAAPVVATMGASAAFTGMGAVGQAAAGLGAGAVTDFLMIDPKGERLSDMLVNDVPELKNYPLAYGIAEKLSSKPGDTELDSRFKNMIEGMFVGVPVAAGFLGITKMASMSAKGLKAAKAVKPAPLIEGAEAVVKNIDEEKPLIQGDLFDFAATRKAEDGSIKANLNNDQVLNFATEYIKANPEGAFTRGAKAFSELDSEAKAVLTNADELKKLLEWRLGDRPLKDSEVKAAQYLMRSSTDALTEAAAKYTASKSPEDLLHFTNMVATRNHLLNVKGGAGSEAGRALNAHKVSAEMTGKTVDEFTGILNKETHGELINKALEVSGGEKDLDSLAKSIIAISQLGPDAAANALDKAGRESMGNFKRMAKLIEFTGINGMLSSVKTPISNHVNNFQVASKQIMDNYMAAAIGTIRGNKNAQSFKEANSYFAAHFDAFGEGLHAMGKAIRTGKGGPADIVNLDLVQKTKQAKSATGEQNTISLNVMDASRKLSDVLDIPVERSKGFEILGKIVDTYGMVVGTPTKINATSDAFWGTLSYRGKISQLAIQGADRAKLSGKAAADFIDGFKKNPPAQAHLTAQDWAKKMTFAEALDPDSRVGRLDKLIEDTIPLSKVVFPFFKTSVNVAAYTANNSPLALMLPQSKTFQALRAGGKEADMAAAQVATGSMFLGLGAYMASTGMYSGPETRNPKIIQALAETGQGWQPDSISVNGKWHDIKRLDYVNSVFKLSAVVAGLRNYVSEDEYSQLAVTASAAVTDFLTPERMVDTYARYADAFSDIANDRDPGGAASKIAGEVANNTVPFSALMRDIKTLKDPYKVDQSTDKNNSGLEQFIDRVINRYRSVTPWFSEDLPVQRNIFGEAILAPNGSLEEGYLDEVAGFLSPFSSHRKETTPLVNTLSKMAGFYEAQSGLEPDLPALPIAMPPRSFTFKGVSVDLSPAEYEKYVMYSAGINPETGEAAVPGASLRDALENVRTQILPALNQDLSPKQYRALVGTFSKVITKYRNIGQDVMRNDPEIMKKWKKAFDASIELQDYSNIGGE